MAPVEVTEDYYAILEVSHTAVTDTIKKSYRRLAVLLHPDKNPKKSEATASFQLLLRAYETLSDPEQRKIYDIRWVHIKSRADAQTEARKREAAAAEAQRQDTFNKQREQKAREEQLEQWRQRKVSLERDIFELNRVIRRLAADIKRLQDQDDEEERKARANNSWWTSLTSPIYGRTKETEDDVQHRENERRQRLTGRYIKGFELEKKEGRLKDLTSSLQDIEKKMAAEKARVEMLARAQEAIRQEELRHAEEARRRREEQRARESREAWEREQTERRKQDAARAAEAARRFREAEEKRKCEERERQAREDKEQRERAETVRKAEAARERAREEQEARRQKESRK
ncbi:MAG: hypothetical protein Q9218_008149, partial [Villophora microphyllina]